MNILKLISVTFTGPVNELQLIIYKYFSIHTTFTEACRDSSDYLLCPIN